MTARGDDPHRTATELARLIARREVSAREVVEAHLRRMEAVNPHLNAVVQLDAERALAAADAADRREPQGPLHGVPFTVKDNLSAAGLEMAIGAPERVGVVPAADATAVARLRAAGAILLGKTNCPAYGGGIETDNPVYGRTSNPYDLARTPGGSSGGEAAIVAAGGSPCGLGTDSGASVRLPAHFCGLDSLKPSAGRVPLTGVIDDEGQLGALGDPRTQVGPLARSAEDVALLLKVIAGPDGHDGGVAPVPLGDPAAIDPTTLRVAVQTDNGLAEPTPETAVAVGAAAEALGARLQDARHPDGGHELTIEVWRSHGDETGLWRLLRRWDEFRTRMLAFAARYDLLVCPVFAGPARPHGTMNAPGEIDPTSWTTPHSLTGWPAATVRAGTSPEGLPIGVQLVATPWRDDVALAAAQRIERELGPWPQPAL
ncbi:MAG TPA: amidase [Solirubrobacteraceae bacterium]|nr:amidase [Solirubrobacteraceae bacterium]